MSTFTPAQKRAYAISMARRRKVIALQADRKDHVITGRRRRTYPVRTNYVRGRGDYTKSIGGRVGTTVGGAIGGAIGYGIQNLISTITGSGDYTVTSNSLMPGLYSPPELRNLRDRSVVVRHREYLTDISASSSFTIYSYPINPGLVTSFPWLSQVAEAFEEYYITGMIYEFKTLSADYTTASSAALGYVIMSTQYNVLNPVFPDKITMENYEFSNSRKPSETFIHPIECKKSVNPISELYVRTGAVPSGADARLYDLGMFQIATGGNTGSGVLGELWVTFEVVLCKPKLVSAVGYQVLSDHFTLGTVTNSAPLGTTTVAKADNTLGGTVNTAGTIYSFPPTRQDGVFQLQLIILGTGAAVASPSISLTNCSTVLIYLGDAHGQVNCPGNGETGSYFTLNQMVKITGLNATVTYGGAGTLPSSVTYGDLLVSEWNGSLL